MRNRLPEGLLAIVTLIWGSTFIVGQIALKEIGVFGFLSLRFAIGAAVLALVGARRLRRLTAQELKAGAGIGVVLFAAYAMQALGLPSIASSKSAFITSIYVPLVPAIQFLLLGRQPASRTWLGAGISFAGLILLSLHEGMTLSFGYGEWLTLGSAVCSALQIVLIGKVAAKADPVRLGVVQLAVVALISLAVMPFTHETFPLFSAKLAGICLGMGVLATALSLAAMNWAQQTICAAKATLIYAMEPVWAGLIAVVIGESMPPLAIVGACFVLCGILVAELSLPRVRTPAGA